MTASAAPASQRAPQSRTESAADLATAEFRRLLGIQTPRVPVWVQLHVTRHPCLIDLNARGAL
jgi:hypothetical protein